MLRAHGGTTSPDAGGDEEGRYGWLVQPALCDKSERLAAIPNPTEVANYYQEHHLVATWCINYDQSG